MARGFVFCLKHAVDKEQRERPPKHRPGRGVRGANVSPGAPSWQRAPPHNTGACSLVRPCSWRDARARPLPPQRRGPRALRASRGQAGRVTRRAAGRTRPACRAGGGAGAARGAGCALPAPRPWRPVARPAALRGIRARGGGRGACSGGWGGGQEMGSRVALLTSGGEGWGEGGGKGGEGLCVGAGGGKPALGIGPHAPLNGPASGGRWRCP